MKQFFLILGIFGFLFSVALSANAQPITWKSTNGPYGYPYPTQTFLLPNGDLLAGYYLSTDRGDHWKQVIHPAPLESIGVFLADHQGRLYAISVYDTSQFNIILRSDDEGKTWFRQSHGMETIYTQDMIQGRDNDIFAFGLGGEVFLSTDRGDNWLQISKLPTIYFAGGASELAMDSVGTMYALTGTGSGYRSRDHGKTWQILNTGLQPAAVACNKKGNVFVLGSTPSSTATYVSRSSDMGITWTNASVPQSFAMGLDLVAGANNDLYIFRPLFSDYSQPFICKSTDAGVSWNTLLPGIDSVSLPAPIYARIDPDGRLYVSLEGGGLWKSLDGGRNWSSSNTGIILSQVRQGIVTRSGALITQGYFDVLRKYENGSWQYLPNVYRGTRFAGDVALAKNTAGDIFSSASGSGIFKSTDDGSSWTHPHDYLSIDTIVLTPSFQISYVYPTQLCFDSSGIIYAGASRDLSYNGQAKGNGVYISTDDGISWKKAGPSLIDSNILALESGKDGTIYAGTTSGIFRSTDHAQTWIQLQGLPSSYRGNSITVAPSGSIYVGDSVLIYRSDDKGISWIPLAAIHPKSAITQILVRPDNSIFAVLDSGYFALNFPAKMVFFSKDAGKTWTDITQGLLPNFITTDNKGKYYLCTEGQGVYEYTFPNAVSSATTVPEMNVSITPNPASNIGRLHITSSKREKLSVKLYDIKGSAILTLYEGISPASLTIPIDLSGLVPGTYELRGLSNSKEITQKMVVIH